MTSLILASTSPRRKELLGRLGWAFTVQASEADESLPAGLSPGEAVVCLARRKANAVARMLAEPAWVLGADTVVALDGRILGKPRDEAEAAWMLRQLSGAWHEVHTGVCLLQTGGGEEAFSDCTRVHFTPMDDQAIAGYVATGEPMDKAGAYGIQGWAGAYIDRIEGCFFNVMGLPLAKVRQALQTWMGRKEGKGNVAE